MTAPDQPTEHAADQLLTAPKSPADDLRQQLTDVLRRRLGSQLDLFPHAPEFLADGVMAEVQPVIDAKDTEIRNLAALADIIERIPESHVTLGDVAMSGGDKCVPWCVPCLRQRAETAEAVANNIGAKAGLLRLDLATAIKRAETAERELAALRTRQQTGDQP